MEAAGDDARGALQETRSEVSQLRRELSSGLDAGNALLQRTADEVRHFLRTSQAQQEKRLQDALDGIALWQREAEGRLEKLGEMEGSCAAVAEQSRMACTDVGRVQEQLANFARDASARQRRLEEGQQELREALARSATELSETFAGQLRAQDLRVLELETESQATATVLERLNSEVSQLRAESEAWLERRMVELEASLGERVSEEVRQGSAAVERRLADMFAELEQRVSRELDPVHSVALRTWLGNFEARNAARFSSAASTVKADLGDLRKWMTQYVVSEVGRSATIVGSKAEDALESAERRRDIESSQTMDRVSSLADGLVAVETLIKTESGNLRRDVQRLTANINTLAAKQSGDFNQTHESLSEMAAVQSRTDALQDKRFEDLVTKVCDVDHRLGLSEDASENSLKALSLEHDASTAQLAAESAADRRYTKAVVGELESADLALREGVAAADERLTELASSEAGARAALAAESASAAAKCEALAQSLARAEAREVAGSTRASERVAQLAAEQSKYGGGLAVAQDALCRLGREVESAEATAAITRERSDEATEALSSELASETAVVKDNTREVERRVARLNSSLSAFEKAQRLQDESFVAEFSSQTDALSRTDEHIQELERKGEALRKEAMPAIASCEQRMAGNENATRELFTKLSARVSGLEAIKEKEDASWVEHEYFEACMKKQFTWVMNMLQPLHVAIDKLTGGLGELGASHESSCREYETLDQVVRALEVRTFPWRSGLGPSTLETVRNDYFVKPEWGSEGASPLLADAGAATQEDAQLCSSARAVRSPREPAAAGAQRRPRSAMLAGRFGRAASAPGASAAAAAPPRPASAGAGAAVAAGAAFAAARCAAGGASPSRSCGGRSFGACTSGTTVGLRAC
eukprot:TRINITY_DN11300_c0_g1_i2.p1 TRINITY_DN11300_c0_g1~~TRINITY_DN11300_c0_g1_i2.p1  ORF type:complete len:885 (+),score=222.62 TRINITY_DN11300_c0_g1_i2:106-2760(+)